MLKLVVPAFALAATMPAAAMADQAINVPPFRSIELHGGGEATLRHGDHQRVVMIKGDLSVAQIQVVGDKLILSPCKDWCWGEHELKVEITTPSVTAISVHGGGDLRADGGFPRQANLNVEVHGGGDADVKAIAADNVSAEVHGGGDAEVRAERRLDAEVHGGGDLHFWGHPQVNSSTHGGGNIESGE